MLSELPVHNVDESIYVLVYRKPAIDASSGSIKICLGVLLFDVVGNLYAEYVHPVTTLGWKDYRFLNTSQVNEYRDDPSSPFLLGEPTPIDRATTLELIEGLFKRYVTKQFKH